MHPDLESDIGMQIQQRSVPRDRSAIQTKRPRQHVELPLVSVTVDEHDDAGKRRVIVKRCQSRATAEQTRDLLNRIARALQIDIA